MRSWTRQQLDAVNARGRSVIVSAAAGSGKTSVLVERLLRIIADRENPVPVERMVVVTFTNAAAAEMKQRLSLSLSALLEKDPSDRWLSRQHALLGTASISTIHSFCFNLIRDNNARIDLSADFRIIDETEQKVFSDTVLSELMDEMYERSPEGMKLLCDNFCGNNDTPLVKMIPELYNNVSSVPFYESWLSGLDSLYRSDMYTEAYLKNIKSELSSCHEALDDLISAASDLGELKVSEMLDDDMNILKKAEDYVSSGDFAGLGDYISSVKFKNFPATKKDVIYPEERELIKQGRNRIKEFLKSLPDYRSIIENAPDDLERHRKIMAVLSEILIEYDKRLYELKVRKNAIGFDDAEQITLRLLGSCGEDGKIEKTELGEEISCNYDLIMVDEFQDSNDRQDMIFRLLSRGGTPEKYGSNLFFVGDVKQSIYRFRQANPDNFINAVKAFVPYEENGTENAFIKLSRNFRSSPQVIDFVNYVFRHIMSEDTGDINYDEGEYLISGTQFCEGDRDTHIMLIDKTDAGEDAEAMCIAAKIRSMLDEGVPVSSDGGIRPCEMKDFCILMRNKNLNSVYTECLKKYGLSVSCEDVSGYLKSREISVLLNLLRIVDNPLLDVPLASVMMSPMFMFSADEMAQIRLVNRSGSLYSNLCAVIGEGTEKPLCDSETVIYQKSASLYALISELRLISSFCTLPEIIQTIYDRTDFTSVIQLYRDADRKRANLRLLLEYANSFESANGGGIGGFIRYIDRISETKGDFSSGGSDFSAQNAVSIKTMHKSKGLEFPFVFIAQTDTKFSTQDDRKPYQFSADMGIGFRLQNKERYERFRTIAYEVIGSYNKNKMLGEEMRLLYVALTRAKERLFITLDISEKACAKACSYAADIHKNEGITHALAGSAGSMGDWLLMTLVSHRKGARLREISGIYESYVNEDDFPLSFEEVSPDEDAGEIGGISAESSLPFDENIVRELERAFAFEYDTSLVEVISKLSVSDISKNDETQPLILSRPAFADDEELSAAEKGTALHCFLQFTDFDRLEHDFEGERQRLVKYGHITPRQGEVVRKEDVEAFLSSEIYEMIKNSERVIRERKFLISIEDLELGNDFGELYKGTDGMLNGIMDMIIENDDSVILVDYKTDKVDNPSVLADRYGKQMLLYKKTLEKIQSKPVKSALIYSFYKKTEVRVF
ncbi:MAG: helicase-exonuclease AddAB subunit AddA [Porcipelethomonas sp.]